jgi:Amt family ammonium transporter
MVLNGSLAGLVGITAGADQVSVYESMIIGAIAGAIVVFSVLGMDRLKLDDPVGAISVHLVCGIWGTLAAGIFGAPAVSAQVIGILAYGAVAFSSALIFFFALKYSPLGLRVSAKEEIGGLDVGEHGMEAYSGFQIFTTT